MANRMYEKESREHGVYSSQVKVYRQLDGDFLVETSHGGFGFIQSQDVEKLMRGIGMAIMAEILFSDWD